MSIRSQATRSQVSKSNYGSKMPGSQTKPGYDAKNTAIITMDELARIKESCSLKKDVETELRQMERKTLQEKSNARVKNWPNTITAMRKKREDDRIKRLEEEEVRTISIKKYRLKEESQMLRKKRCKLKCADKSLTELI